MTYEEPEVDPETGIPTFLARSAPKDPPKEPVTIDWAKEKTPEPSRALTVQPSSVAEWAERINNSCRKTMAAIIEVGRELIAAQTALGHGKWKTMFGPNGEALMLPFGKDVAEDYKRITNNTILSKTDNYPFLPPSYNKLGLLAAKLKNAELQEAIDARVIHSEMSLKEVKKLLPKEKPKAPAAESDDDAESDDAGSTEVDRTKEARSDHIEYIRKHLSGLTIAQLAEVQVMVLSFVRQNDEAAEVERKAVAAEKAAVKAKVKADKEAERKAKAAAKAKDAEIRASVKAAKKTRAAKKLGIAGKRRRFP
jgi:hypothetical protein